MKKIGKRVIISIVFLIVMICTAVFAVNNSEAGLSVSAATEESKYEYHNGSFYLPEDEAKAFLGFVYDLNPDDLNDKLEKDGNTILDLLTGKYAGSEDEKPMKMVAVQLILNNLNAKIQKYDSMNVVSSDILLEWLYAKIDMDNQTQDVINGECDEHLDELKATMLDIALDSGLASASEISAVSDIIVGWHSSLEVVSKAKETAEAVRAGLATIGYAASSSRTAMYKYFISYIQNRDLADSTVDGFEIAMDYNLLALSSEGLYDPFLNWASKDHIKVLNRWAELIYWLSDDLGKVDFDNDESTDDEEDVPVVEFTPGTKVYTGQCGENVYYCLDTQTGILDIYGNGKMYDYSSGKAPWYNYRQYVYKLNIRDEVTYIGNYAFYNCSTLSFAGLGYDLTGIGNYAFSNCTGLTKAVIPNGVTSVGSYAFNNCTALKKIVIPDSITTIKSYMFYNCTGLTSVAIPDSVTDIGNYAFYNCNGIKQLILPASAKIYNSGNSFYNCSNVEKVTFIKGTGTMQDYGTSSSSTEYTYYEHTPWYLSRNSIKKIIIEEGVENIGNYVFCDCSNLENMTIPDSVTYIGEGTFCGCTSLESITIPDGVTGIGYCAFYGCTSLESITIPDSLSYIDGGTFYVCENLSNVYYTGDVTDWCNISFYDETANPMYNADYLYMNGTLVTDLVIPNSVTSIGDYVFTHCDNLVSVTIPDSVKYIGFGAFDSCTKLTSVTIPDSVTLINGFAFSNCTSLTSVTIIYGLEIIEPYVFAGCISLESIIIPNSVTIMLGNTFHDCISLKSITISDSVTYIGDGTFYGCASLESITIPDGVTDIGNYAFYKCTGLTSITFPDSVTNIGDYAFCDCTGLTSVTIPDSVTNIGDHAFYGCENMEYLHVSANTVTLGKNIIPNNTYICSNTEDCYAKTYADENGYTFKLCDNHITHVESISFDAPEIEMVNKSEYQFIPTISPEDADDKTVTWSSNNETVATVDKNGLVTSNSLGTAIITATTVDGGYSANCKITVLPREFTVTWIVDSVETVKTENECAIITKPLDPEKLGYTFTGWTPEVPDVMPTQDLEFTAVFTPNTYNAVFDANGGAWADGAETITVSTEFDTEIIAPENPSKQGYVFSKWTPEVGKMDDINGKLFAAEWLPTTDTVYTVETYKMNTAGEYEKSVRTFAETTDSTVTAEYTVENGFALNKECSVLSGIVAADNSLVLKVYIDRNTYVFETIVDGVSTETEYLYGSIIAEPSVPVKQDYMFIEWNPEIPETMPAEKVTVTAIFKKAYICLECGNEILGEDAINEHIADETVVTISSGTVVSGELKPYSTITAKADRIDGKVFKCWTIEGATASDANSSETTIVLDSGKISITAEYDDCECKCHQSGVVGFFYKIVLFFQKLFGNNLECFCGTKH